MLGARQAIENCMSLPSILTHFAVKPEARSMSNSSISRRKLIGLGALSPLLVGFKHADDPNLDFAAEFDPMWKRTQLYTMEVAEAMPEQSFGYRPVETVRTFAEQVMHIAGANFGFAGLISGNPFEEPPNTDVEGKSKTEMLEVLNTSFEAVVERMLGMAPAKFEERIRWTRRLGADSTNSRRGVALTLWHHTAHHRAQMVVYLRMNGIEPPGYVD